MDSAPQAPALPQLEWSDANKIRKLHRSPAWSNKWTRLTHADRWGRRGLDGRSAHPGTPPSSQDSTSNLPQQLQLHQIAANVTNRPVPQLTRDQWLETREQVSFKMDVKQIGSMQISGAEATVIATETKWSNNFGESCVLSELGRAPVRVLGRRNEVDLCRVGLLVRFNSRSHLAATVVERTPVTGTASPLGQVPRMSPYLPQARPPWPVGPEPRARRGSPGWIKSDQAPQTRDSNGPLLSL